MGALEQTCARLPMGNVGSSNPHRWRGERLRHHGDGVEMICAFCVVLTRDLSVGRVLPTC